MLYRLDRKVEMRGNVCICLPRCHVSQDISLACSQTSWIRAGSRARTAWDVPDTHFAQLPCCHGSGGAAVELEKFRQCLSYYCQATAGCARSCSFVWAAQTEPGLSRSLPIPIHLPLERFCSIIRHHVQIACKASP